MGLIDIQAQYIAVKERVRRFGMLYATKEEPTWQQEQLGGSFDFFKAQGIHLPVDPLCASLPF